MNSKGRIQINPIIAVVIIVAITVVLAAILYVRASGSFCGSKDTPKGDIQIVGSDDNNYFIKVIDMNPTVGVTGMDWFLYDHNGQTVGSTYGSVDEIYCLYEGNVTFHDVDLDGKVSPEDMFVVAKELPDGTKIPVEYSLSLKFSPTNDVISTAVLKDEGSFNKNEILKPKQEMNIAWTEENNTISLSNPQNSHITNRYQIIGRGDKNREEIISIFVNNGGNRTIEELNITFMDGIDLIGDIKVINLSAHDSKKAQISWEIPRDIDIGNHKIKIIVDPNNKNEYAGLNASFEIAVVDAIVVVNSFDTSIEMILLAIVITSILSLSNKKKHNY